MARELIGALLVVDPGTREHVVARIVETEAYLGTRDAASHAFRGPTPRAAIMFGDPAHLYVYFSYGMHHCANIVTEAAGTAGAVLLRAAAVESGEDVVRARRASTAPAAQLLRGPGNLCKGLGLTLLDNGTDLCGPHSRLHVLRPAGAPLIVTAPRVGISAATERPLRFAAHGDPAVSAPLPWRSTRETRVLET